MQFFDVRRPMREVSGRPEDPRKAGGARIAPAPPQRVMCSTMFRVTSFSVRL
jgi:hypothetical protein